MRNKSGVTLRQILERARNRAERGEQGKYPRVLAYRPGDGRDGGEWLALEFQGGSRMYLRYHADPAARLNTHDSAGYIPRDVVEHANEVRSGDDPAAQFLTMHRIAPTAPSSLIDGIVHLWDEWALKALDLWKEETA